MVTTALLQPAVWALRFASYHFEFTLLCAHWTSEINVLSLGNTQEMVSFIVLSSPDNCFATVPQIRKLWLCKKVWATVCTWECLSTIYCNTFSNNHCVNCSCYFPSLSFLSVLSENCQPSKTSVEILRLPSIVVFEDWFCCFCLHAHCTVPKCSSL